MITPYNILRHELIGLPATVARSRDKTADGITGEIIRESGNTITIKTKKGEKTLIKENVTLKIELPKKSSVEVEGSLLSGRPQDRTKKRIRITFNQEKR